MKIGKQKHYYYIVKTTKPVYPRHIAGELLSISGHTAETLVSVTDVQNDQHIYGRTYQVHTPLAQQAVPERVHAFQAELARDASRRLWLSRAKRVALSTATVFSTAAALAYH